MDDSAHALVSFVLCVMQRCSPSTSTADFLAGPARMLMSTTLPHRLPPTGPHDLTPLRLPPTGPHPTATATHRLPPTGPHPTDCHPPAGRCRSQKWATRAASVAAVDADDTPLPGRGDSQPARARCKYFPASPAARRRRRQTVDLPRATPDRGQKATVRPPAAACPPPPPPTAVLMPTGSRGSSLGGQGSQVTALTGGSSGSQRGRSDGQGLRGQFWQSEGSSDGQGAVLTVG